MSKYFRINSTRIIISCIGIACYASQVSAQIQQPIRKRELQQLSTVELHEQIENLLSQQATARNEAYFRILFESKLPALTEKDNKFIERLVKSSHKKGRLMACYLLRKQTASDSYVMTNMIDMLLNDSEDRIQIEALVLLYNNPIRCQRCLGSLLKMLNNTQLVSIPHEGGHVRNVVVRDEAIRVLAKFVEEEHSLLPVLRAQMHLNKENTAGIYAARALYDLEKETSKKEEAYQVLAKALKSQDFDALLEFDGSLLKREAAALDVIEFMVSSQSDYDKDYAADLLVLFETHSAELMSRLRQLAKKDQSEQIRRIAQETIDAIQKKNNKEK